MARNSGQINDGLRGAQLPSNTPAPTTVGSALNALKGLNEQLNLKPGEVLFKSRMRGFRLQLSSTADRIDPTTGGKYPGKSVFIQFRDDGNGLGFFKTSDPEHIAAIRKCKSFVSHDIWDEAELRAQTADKHRESIVQMVKNDPALHEALREVFEHGFVLPARTE